MQTPKKPTNITEESNAKDVVHYYFSHSALGVYDQCERKYFYRYIMGVKGEKPFVEALDFGSTVHEMVETALAQPYEDRVEFMDNLIVNKIEEIDEDDQKNYEVKLLGLRKQIPLILPKYDIKLNGIEQYVYTDMFDVDELEESWSQTFLNIMARRNKDVSDCLVSIRIGGYIDAFLEEKDTKKNTVIDWKTGKYYTKPEWIEKYLKQIQLYSYILRANGKEVNAGKLVYLEYAQEHEVDVSEKSCEKVFNKHKETVLEIMKKEEFIHKFQMTDDINECLRCEYSIFCKK